MARDWINLINNSGVNKDTSAPFPEVNAGGQVFLVTTNATETEDVRNYNKDSNVWTQSFRSSNHPIVMVATSSSGFLNHLYDISEIDDGDHVDSVFGYYRGNYGKRNREAGHKVASSTDRTGEYGSIGYISGNSDFPLRIDIDDDCPSGYYRVCWWQRGVKSPHTWTPNYYVFKVKGKPPTTPP